MYGSNLKMTQSVDCEFSESVPIFCCQKSASKRSSFICASCHQFAGTSASHLMLASGETRKDILKGKKTTVFANFSNCLDIETRSCNTDNNGIPKCCTFQSSVNKQTLCTEVYCSDDCRQKHEMAHSLLCRNGESMGSPLYEFHRYVDQCGKIGETILFSATFLADHIAQVIELSMAKIKENNSHIQENTSNLPQEVLDKLLKLCDESIAVDVCQHLSSVQQGQNVHQCAYYHFTEEIESEISEAFYLFRNGIYNRINAKKSFLDSTHLVESIEPFLNLTLFLRIAYMMKLRLLSIQLTSNLPTLCNETSEKILQYVTVTETAKRNWVLSSSSSSSSSTTSTFLPSRPPQGLLETLNILLTTCRKICEKKNPNLYRKSSSSIPLDLQTQLDLLLCQEAKECEKECQSSVPSSSSASSSSSARTTTLSSLSRSSIDDDSLGVLIVLARRAKLIAQCAPRLFASTELCVLSVPCFKLRHSCIPTSQLQLNSERRIPISTSVLFSSSNDISEFSSLIQIRSLLPNESLSLSWIEFDGQCDVMIRAKLLCDRFGADFICNCKRCIRERKVLDNNEKEGGEGEEEEGARGSKDDSQLHEMILFARDCIESGNFKEATTILLKMVKLQNNQQEVKAVVSVNEDNDVSGCIGGDAWVLLGLCYLNLNEWSIAASAWRKGYQLYPQHIELAKQAFKDKAYVSRILEEDMNEIERLADVIRNGGGDNHVEDIHDTAGIHDANASNHLPLALNKNKNSIKNIECEVFELGQNKLRLVSTLSPVLSMKECEYAIQLAEEYVLDQGWTTTRHHAVPTTDIAVHNVPKLLSWFNYMMDKRISPLLAHYFGNSTLALAPNDSDTNSHNSDPSSSHNSSGVRLTSSLLPPSTLGQFEAHHVKVHDAFLVRYKAGYQTHLPLHIDESHLSFTIPLNSYEANNFLGTSTCGEGRGGGYSGGGYSGGGTYFADLKRSILKEQGSLVMFEGHCLHGGDPVVFGTRYILAVFLYIDKESSNPRLIRSFGECGSNSSSSGSRGVSGVSLSSSENHSDMAKKNNKLLDGESLKSQKVLPWDKKAEDEEQGATKKQKLFDKSSTMNDDKPSFSFNFF